MPNTEPWVGTWRPHKPRGPINAMYKSPGPKYALPGLTGEKQHSLTKVKAPSYSFGTRHVQPPSNQSPGPQYMVPSNITRVGRVGTPAFSLYGRQKDPSVFQSPAPGQYSLEKATKSIFQCAPAFSLSGRQKERTNDRVPGPATYRLPEVLGAQTALFSSPPMYSMCGRSKTGGFAEDLKKTPGPAAYRVVDTRLIKERPPQYSMTGRNFAPAEGTKTPGPGTYRPEMVTTTKSNAPRYSFGLRHSEFTAPLIPNADD